ncbi:ATP-dependent DNA helicase RecG [Aggregatilineales bacterium SYSU G02658]
MPSALETLVKVLKQERENGCNNQTIIGGLGAYSEQWSADVRSEARRAEHLILAEELPAIMRAYDSTDDKRERIKRINYMLDRITGRAPVPSQFRQQLEALKAQFSAQNATPTKEAREKREPGEERSPREEPRRERPPRGELRPQRGGERSAVELPRTPTPDQAPRPERPARGEKSRPERGTKSAREGDRRTAPARTEPQQPRMTDSPREVFEFEYKFINPQGSDLKPLPRMERPPRQARPDLSLEEAMQRLQQLRQPVTVIKGVGQKIADTLAPLGIRTVENLIYYLPRRYDDYTRLNTINHLELDLVNTVVGKVTKPHLRVSSSGRRDFALTLEDGTGRMDITFFGGHYLRNVLREGMQIVVSGKVTLFGNRFQMTNPEWEQLEKENLHTVGIVPVYRLKEGIKPRSFRRMMKQAVDTWSTFVPDYMPVGTLERADLADLGWTIRNLHFPEGWDHLEHARRRRVFDELLLLQLAILGNRRDWQAVPGIPLKVEAGFLDSFLAAAFPYEMTSAQMRAIHDILDDVQRPVPMNRLVQGDVGAGKTAVAITAMALAVHNGMQAALMAPTSILAEQHYRGVSSAFANFPGERPPTVRLLTGALSASEREAVYRGLADGQIDVVVGTHALIQEGVEFKQLAVAVVDEQHRFGVEQRARLRGKGTHPHLLVMTATPIPRTLALTMYADLDLSVIDEKPKGRRPIKTQINLPSERERVYDFIESQLNQGRQAFIIHPLVEASEDETSEARSAVEAYEELKRVFFHHRVCLLHGRMSPREKDEIMAAFSRHEYDIMVTTSVAEVGVDIPNASVIMIESANRFGLAQLHQFRGRVGRGEHESFCILMVESGIFEPYDLADNDQGAEREWTPAQQRLLKMRETDDGFALAELDWRLRGAGDLLGARQSGVSSLQLTELMMPDLVALAQQEARTIYEQDPNLERPEHQLLRQLVLMQTQDVGDVS